MIKKMSDKKTLTVKKREKGEIIGEEMIPAVLYGPKRESVLISINKRDFTKIYQSVGESSLIILKIEDNNEKISVLIYETQKKPITGEIIHVDFLEPNLKEKVEAEVALVFTGESPAVKAINGTLIKNFYTVNVKALPEKLPHEINVDVGKINTIEDVVCIKDLDVSSDVEIMHEKDAVVAMVSAPEDVEAELEKPIEEGEEPEVIGEKEKDETKEEDEEKKDTNKEQPEKD